MKITPCVNLLLQYASFTACNIPLAKIGNVAAKQFLDREISIDSGYYTILAMIAAVLSPSLFGKGKQLYEHRDSLLSERSMKYLQKLAVSFLLVLLPVMSYGILWPLEIFSGNTKDFAFGLHHFLWPLLAISICILLMAAFILALLPDWPFRIASALLLWFGVSSWLQNLFMNIKLTESGGLPMDWESLGSYPKLNLLIWLIILLSVLFLCVRLKSWFSFSKLVAGGLIVVQFVALVSVCITMPEAEPGTLQLSGDEQMKLSPDENFIVFVFDSIDNSILEDLFAQAPEEADILKDFEWFDNAECQYYFTFPSVTHFLTGSEFDFEQYGQDWVQDSWTSDRAESFYAYLADAGYRRTVYEPPESINGIMGKLWTYSDKFDNVGEVAVQVNLKLLLTRMLTLSIYRGMPYVLKEPFEVMTSDFDGVVTPLDSKQICYANYDYLERLRTEQLSVDTRSSKRFVVQNLQGVHYPRNTSAQGTYQENATYEETARGVMALLQEYINQMKELGLYDSATIIIMADHGRNPLDVDNEISQPVFLLKRAGETHNHLIVNHAPVTYDDFQATVLTLIDKNDGTFGTSFFDWHEGDSRDRTVYIRFVDPGYPKANCFSETCYYEFHYNGDGDDLAKNYAKGPDRKIPFLGWCP